MMVQPNLLFVLADNWVNSGAMRQTMLLCQRFPSSYTTMIAPPGWAGLLLWLSGCWVVRLLFAGGGQCNQDENEGKKRTRSK